MTTLNQRQVQQVLSRLYAEAQANDSKVQAEEKALLAAAGGIIDDQTLQSINDRLSWLSPPEVGRLICLLVRSRRPALAVEFGTSFGLSAIHIASALRDNRFVANSWPSKHFYLCFPVSQLRSL
jgi:predicted O-methyltransferase YrrM